jgi:hypothetical protein
MSGDEGYFDERVAARYDESAAETFEPAVVDPIVDCLSSSPGAGARSSLGSGPGRIEPGGCFVIEGGDETARREPFASGSRDHVSVWEKPAATP